ncbi:MAG: hypothetical protein ACM359_02070 [Bacillota bacterium]
MSTVPPQKMVEHCQQITDSGLAGPMDVPTLKANGSFPTGWFCMGTQKTLLYSHCQWRSPSKRTAVGITYVRMPLPLSTNTLIWMARGEISKRTTDGKLMREWTDEIGRHWFEAEDGKYHTIGYVMTRGFDAWINYTGYRVGEPKEEAEVALAGKSLETILPASVAGASQPMKTASAQ